MCELNILFATETEFEEALVNKLTKLDNQWSRDVLNYKTQDELIQNWADILFRNNIAPEKLNNCPLTKTEVESLINYVNSRNTPYEINKLLNSNELPLKRDNPSDKLHYGRYVYLNIFDKTHIAAGETVYQIARQPVFHLGGDGDRTKRGDLTLLINGLPLIHIELKKNNVPIGNAVEQIKTYSDRGVFTGLFSFVQVFVAMTPTEAVYFANPGRDGVFNSDYYFHWGDFNNRRIDRWLDVASEFLSIPMAHRLIGYGTVADAKDKSLKVLRSYQFYAAFNIYSRVLSRGKWDCPDQKGGFIYHTTGSGKTLTSFKCAQLIADSRRVDKIVFLMDRTELWKQTFINYQNFASDEDVSDTSNVASLKTKLCSDDVSQLIVTSIQKMSRLTEGNSLITPDELSKIQRKRLVFIIDEAHQDVAGTMLRDIKCSYRNASFFGFTGTPIMSINAKAEEFTTRSLFGEQLHSYTILEGIRDKNVLGFKPFKVMTFDGDELKDLVAKKKAGITNLDDATEYQKNKYFEWMNKDYPEIENELPDGIYSEGTSGERHRKAVVDDILKKWDVLSYNGLFHHILATSSIREAIAYYNLMKNNDKGLKVTAIFDPYTDNREGDVFKEDAVVGIIDDYNRLFGTSFVSKRYSTFKEDVCARLGHTGGYQNLDSRKDEAVNIVIVVNQLLTGFDSRWINTLYLDKMLEYERYIQACSRTNRLFDYRKPYGVIKYYRKPYTMEENAEKALRLYIENNGYKEVYASSLGHNLLGINNCFKGIRNIFERNGIDNYATLPESEDDRKLFVDYFNNMNLCIEKAIPELFNWTQKEYFTEDAGRIEVELDKYTYEILKLRYRELSNRPTPGGDPPDYDIKTYLTEISDKEISYALLQSKYSQFVKDITNGASEEEIAKMKNEVRANFAVLDEADQKTADIILNDILSGKLEGGLDPDKSFKDYIDLYNHNILMKRIDQLCHDFGFDKNLIITTMKYNLTEESLNRYNRFSKIMETRNFDQAQETLARENGMDIPPFRVDQYLTNILRSFLISGGTSITDGYLRMAMAG